MRAFFISLFCAGLVLAPAAARDVEGIAAIVNDEVISLYDLDQRIDLFFATSGIEKSPQTAARLRDRILRALIDEKLQLQEARRVEIEIETEEIDESITRLEQGNRMDEGALDELLTENGIRTETLESQIRAELAWDRFVRRRFGGRITISDAEVDERYDQIRRAADEPHYLVSEILLDVDDPGDTARIREVSGEIVAQLERGVDFGVIAQQFSVSPSAAQGGRIGWVSTRQLDPRLGAALERMETGRISPPIATPVGIYILALIDRRHGGDDPMKSRVDILSLAFEEDTDDEKLAAFREGFRDCTAAEAEARGLGARVARTGFMELGDLQTEIRNRVAGLEAGQMTAPAANIYVVCDRRDVGGFEISRVQIADNLYAGRMSMMARRHLRDLRRDAVVEYRRNAR